MTVTNLDSAQKTVTLTTTSDGMNAHTIRVAWASSDTATTLGTSASAAATSIQTSTPGQVPAATSTSTSTAESEPEGGLSTGAKTGVGVGVGIVGAALLGGFAWFLVRKRKSAGGAPAELGNKPPTPWEGNDSRQGGTQQAPAYQAPVYQAPVYPSTQPIAQPAAQPMDYYSTDQFIQSKPTELDGETAQVLHEMESPQKTPESLGGSTLPRLSMKRLHDWRPAS